MSYSKYQRFSWGARGRTRLFSWAWIWIKWQRNGDDSLMTSTTFKLIGLARDFWEIETILLNLFISIFNICVKLFKVYKCCQCTISKMNLLILSNSVLKYVVLCVFQIWPSWHDAMSIYLQMIWLEYNVPVVPLCAPVTVISPSLKTGQWKYTLIYSKYGM